MKENILASEENKVENNVQLLDERVNEIIAPLLEQYETIHENPELGGEEFETAKIVRESLEKMGIKILAEGLGGAGIVAEIVGKESGPTIALRADMDALQMTENKSHEIKSAVDGKMHACGHDIHTVSLLGAAQILKEKAGAGDLDGRVILIFQSNEEKAIDRASGSIPVIKFLEKSGVRKDIKSFFALHVLAMLERGTMVLADDVQYAGSSFVDVKLKTVGGHGSEIKVLPDIDYILSDIKVRIADALVDYYERDEAVVDSMAPKTTYEADNIILSSGGRSWIVRVMTEDYKRVSKEIHEKIRGIIQESVSSHLARTLERAESKGIKKNPTNYDIELDIVIKPHTRPTIHRNKDLVNIVNESGKRVLEDFKRINKKNLATDDFSFFLEEFRGQEIPGVYAAIGGANTENGYPSKPHHSPDFAVDPNVIGDLIKVHVTTAISSLGYFNSRISG
jgi:amidohydrolase